MKKRKKIVVALSSLFLVVLLNVLIAGLALKTSSKGVSGKAILEQEDNSLIFNNRNEFSLGNINIPQLFTDNLIPNLTIEKPKQITSSYIVKLKEEPLAVKEKALENEIKILKEKAENERKIGTLSKANNIEKLANEKEKQMQITLKEHKNKIEIEHINAIKDINNIKGDITGQAVSEEIKIQREYKNVFNGFALEISVKDAEKIKKSTYVKAVYPDLEVKAFLMDSVPLINATQVWQLDEDGNNCSVSGKPCLTGQGVKIAIVDTGIDYTHVDLGGCFGAGCKVISGWDFVNNDNDPMDDYGHGTHVAGIAAGNGALKGVAPDAKLYAYKVLDNRGSGTFSNIIAAIEKAVGDRADIISMSLGAICYEYNEDCGPEDAINQVVNNAVDTGVVIVISAGNSGPYYSNTESYFYIGSPGTAEKAITVGATYKSNFTRILYSSCLDENKDVDSISCLSSRGPVIWQNKSMIKPEIVAPGVYINSTIPGNKYVTASGTSMAAPHVSGAAALLKQAHPEWTAQQIKNALTTTAKDIMESYNLRAKFFSQGHGRLKALDAVQMQNPPIAIINPEKNYNDTIVQINGTAFSLNFKNYTLYFYNGSEWKPVCYSESSVQDGILCDLDIRFIEDREYFLKLVVNSENEYSEAYSFFVKNTFEIKLDYKLYSRDEYDYYYPIATLYEENFPIIGTVSGYGFDRYEIEVCNSTFEDCSQESIIMTRANTEKANNEQLAILNISKLDNHKLYSLIIKKYSNWQENPEIKQTLFFVSKEMAKFGQRINMPLGSFANMLWPLIADMNNDGKEDVIIYINKVYSVTNETLYNTIYTFDENLNQLPGWPFKLATDYENQIIKKMVAGDFDNDGYNEFVFLIGYPSLFQGLDNDTGIHILNHKGEYEKEPIFLNNTFVYDMVMDDINNDGSDDILFLEGNLASNETYNLTLHVFDINGYLPGWPKEIIEIEEWANRYQSGISISDINNDNKKEIVLIINYVNYSTVNETGSAYQQRILLLNSSGDFLEGSGKTYVGENVGWAGYFLPISDINNDNKKEIAQSYSYIPPNFYFLNYTLGEEIEPLNRSIIDSGCGAIIKVVSIIFALGDLNNDNYTEIIILNKDGKRSMISLLNRNTAIFCNISSYSYPFIADIDSDNDNEILLPQFSITLYNQTIDNRLTYYYLIYTNSSINLNMSLVDNSLEINSPYTYRIIPYPLVLDIDGDKKNEILFFTVAGTFYIWHTEGKTENNKWSMYRADSGHTGDFTKETNARDIAVAIYVNPVRNQDGTYTALLNLRNLGTETINVNYSLEYASCNNYGECNFVVYNNYTTILENITENILNLAFDSSGKYFLKIQSSEDDNQANNLAYTSFYFDKEEIIITQNGNGGGGGGTTIKNITCTEKWQCSEWTNCSNEKQTRTCTDLNSCNTTINKPTISQACTEVPGVVEAEKERQEAVRRTINILFVIFGFVALLVIIFFVLRKVMWKTAKKTEKDLEKLREKWKTEKFS